MTTPKHRNAVFTYYGQEGTIKELARHFACSKTLMRQKISGQTPLRFKPYKYEEKVDEVTKGEAEVLIAIMDDWKAAVFSCWDGHEERQKNYETARAKLKRIAHLS